jgi:hypothetical protein
MERQGSISLETIYARTKMKMSEAMKIKRQIQECFNIEAKMGDLPKVGLILTIERSALDKDSYKLLADYAAENNLNLQLELGRFIISSEALPAAAASFGVDKQY